MSLVEAFVDYLEDNGIATVGTDLFMGDLPLDIENAVACISAPSPAPNKSIPYFVQTVDVWSRSADADVAYTKLFNTMELIHRLANFEMYPYHVYIAYAMGTIEDMDRDAQKRKLYKISFGFVYRVTDSLTS